MLQYSADIVSFGRHVATPFLFKGVEVPEVRKKVLFSKGSQVIPCSCQRQWKKTRINPSYPDFNAINLMLLHGVLACLPGIE